MPDWTDYAIDFGCYRQKRIKEETYRRFFPELFSYTVNIFLDKEFHSTYSFRYIEQAREFIKVYFRVLKEELGNDFRHFTCRLIRPY